MCELTERHDQHRKCFLTPHPQKGCLRFSNVVWFLFYNPLKFDTINADVPFSKRGHNLETKAKLNKAQHPFSNEVPLNMGADFQLIPSEDTCKQTKNVHPYMQFYFIEIKMKNVSGDFHD